MSDILIVDDDNAFREGLAETLIDLGHIVHEAASGKEALGKIKDQAVNLVFLDLRMPDMDGLEVLRRLHADRSK